VETIVSQAVMEPPDGAGSGGADVVMVPSDQDSAPLLPVGDRDVLCQQRGGFSRCGHCIRRGGHGHGGMPVCGLPRHRDHRP
jgi:hypothetical protein